MLKVNLELVPLKRKRRNFGPDSYAYYKEHYPGLTRGQLEQADESLYQKLKRDGNLEKVPLKGQSETIEEKVI